MENCKKCGNNLENNSKFCAKCGDSININVGNSTSSTSGNKKIKSFLIGIVSILVFLLSYGVVRYLTTKGISSVSNKTELTESLMQETANEINKDLPKMIDSETRLDSTVGIKNSLTYKYTLINYSLSDLEGGASLSDMLRNDLVNSVCTTPEMDIFVKNKATLNYSYYDKNGVFIEQITINTGIDCAQHISSTFEESNVYNLDSFTTCLKDKGALLYSAFWCSHCKAQKELFGSSQELLPYVECSTQDATDQTQICKDKKIEGYPTWELADSTRLTGEVPLQTLAERTGCELPQ